VAIALSILMASFVGAAPAPGQAEIKAGMLAFNNHCRECHSFVKGDNRLGPSLYGVVGRKAGTAPGYSNYSDGVKNAGFTWTPKSIDTWITNPEAVIPDNNMKPFGGISDAAQRRKIIIFLENDTKLPPPGRHAAAQ
jgi:cytochrome c